MYYEVFTKEIKTQLEAALGADYKVTLNRVIKNNNMELTAVSILSDDSNMAPNIYLEQFFEKFEEGMSYDEIVKDILNIYYSHIQPSMDVSFFTEFDKVSEHIIFKLINKESNSMLLADTPYVDECGDLCVIFQVLLPQGYDMGSATITIKNNHLELWNKSVTDIYEIAMKNTPVLLPAKLQSMSEIMLDMFSDQIMHSEDSLTKDEAIEIALEMMPPADEMPMYVLTNTNKVNGSGCILYPSVLKTFADEHDCNLFILPSSVHETIIALDDGSRSLDSESLSSMVREVNSSSLASEDVLGSHSYYYDRKTNTITF